MIANSLTQPHVVCPHCWQRFYADDARFISQHPGLFGDAILGENEQKRFARHEVHQQRDGSVLDSLGSKMTERACPECHLQVPPDLLEKRPCFISLVGAPRSGKTYFLTVMIHELRQLSTQFGFSLYDSDSHEVKAFIDYERQLFQNRNPSHLTYLEKTEETGKLYNRVRLAGVDVQLPKPFIFSLRPTAANINIGRGDDRLHQSFVIYDNAGEAFEYLKEKDTTNRATQHLAEADAIFFAYDPLQESGARQRLAEISDDPQLHLAAVNYRQEQILTETINRIRRHRGLSSSTMIDTALCICVQKYDVWMPLLKNVCDDQGDRVRERFSDGADFAEPICRDKKVGLAGLDCDQINYASLIVRDAIESLNPQLVALAESSFKTVRYFPVSALGGSPSPKNEAGRLPMNADPGLLKVRPDDIRPRRVTTPMLWMMQRLRLIHRVKRPNSRAAEKYAHAQIQSAANGVLRVITPNSQRILVLDMDYASSVIEEPDTGEVIWIPAIPSSVAPPPPPPKMPPPNPTSNGENSSGEKPLGLSIKPRRKGWFRR